MYPDNIHPYFDSIFTPASLFLFCGLCNLVYCIADNTDGRLARRDCKTSAIGEYLDHGLDCVTSLLSTCVACLVFSVSTANMAVAVVMVGIVTVLSHTLHV
uniref:Putative CDP-alcohol phosphatidyltransferase class-I family protein 4 n=1 Tax=Lygus hesperus TaxID=30085 RepID=A0A0A9WKX0_LYGHE